MEFIRRKGAEYGFCAIAKQCFYFQQVFAGAAVDDGIGSTGIITYHAADHGAISGGSLRAEKQAMGTQI